MKRTWLFFVFVSALPTIGAPAEKLAPVFIHSLQRANSTFWWNAFRQDPGVLAFNEPFNPELLSLGRGQSDTWHLKPSLRHGYLDRDPYEEYREVGVFPTFSELLAYYPFIWTASSHYPEAKAYIQNLVDAAHARGLVPVIKLNRDFLRIPWFKENFGGTHLFLHRNLGALMNSYYSFRGTQGYFLRNVAAILGLNANEPSFQEIAHYLDLPVEAVNNASDALLRYGRKISAPNKASRQKMTDAVGFLWLLGLASGLTLADIVVDNDALVDPAARIALVDKIQSLTGIRISLEGYRYKDGRLSAEMSTPARATAVKALESMGLACPSRLTLSSFKK